MEVFSFAETILLLVLITIGVLGLPITVIEIIFRLSGERSFVSGLIATNENEE